MPSIFYEALDRALDRLPDRPLDPPDFGNMTDAEINGIQAEVERRANEEVDTCDEKFRKWLNSGAGRRTRLDYQQYRAAMLSEDEQREIFDNL